MRRALLIIGALLLVLAGPAAAQDSTLVIRGFQTELVVQPDGTVQVTEVIRAAFSGRWNGLTRDLLLNHNTAEGDREKLDLQIVRITDGAGNPLRVEEQLEDGGWRRHLRIYVPGAENAEKTVVLRYTLRNAIRFYFADDSLPSFDELYWNVTGTESAVPIESASARIVLPRGVRPTRTAVYTGYAGSTGNDAEVWVDSARGTAAFRMQRGLAPGEGLTVAAGWPAGAIATRPTQAQHQAALRAHRRSEALRMWPLALPFLVFALALRAWRRRGRDPEPESIVVGYEPPEGMSPAELGTLIDNDAQISDVVSTLVDLAVRGYVGIEEREEKQLLGLFSSTEYVFYLRKPREEWGALQEHERLFADALFSHASSSAAWDDVRATFAEARRVHEAGGELDREAFSARLGAAGSRTTETVRMKDLQNRFYKSIPGIQDAIYDRLQRRGYYLHRPDKVKGNWFGLAVAVLVLGGAGAGFSEELAFAAPTALLVGGGVSALILFVFGRVMPARTPAGARAREAALGFREFLARVESDRYRVMITSPEMFERFLPHAMAFGVADRWSRAFDDLYREPPQWYSGTGYHSFRPSSFSSRMGTMTSSASNAMTSSPKSSGSGGGGSSGGGSGGGGVGGF